MDLSRTHDRFGALWVPRPPEQPTAPQAEDRSLDDIDLPRFKAELERRFTMAARTCDGSNLTADQRQYAAGFKNGLREALTLLDVSRRPPTPQAEDNGRGDMGGRHEGPQEKVDAASEAPVAPSAPSRSGL